MCPSCGEARCREINEVLDTCLSPVAHVCFRRSTVCNDASRHFSLKCIYLILPSISRFVHASSFNPVAYPYSRRSISIASSRTTALAKFPLSEFIPRWVKTNGCLSACPTAAKYVSRSPRIEIPGLVNQRGIRAADIYFEQLLLIGAVDSFDLSVYHWQKVTSGIDCTYVFWTSHETDSFLSRRV